MKEIRLGRTGIRTNKNGFGVLPLQRVTMDEAVSILHRALEAGITFYDTARAYSDSEEKLGKAFRGKRDRIYLATKTMAQDVKGFWEQLETSLNNLGTDYVDLYQFHNPPRCYKPGDGTGMYEAMLEAKQQGKIRWIGMTNHRMKVAQEAVASSLYDTLQFPLSYLSGDEETRLLQSCREQNMGFLGMKSLAGGLINNAAAAYAFADQFDNLLPIWGIQHMHELEEFIACQDAPPTMNDAAIREVIEADRKELLGQFCRGCGYCLPCPADIEIFTAARMSLLLRRAPAKGFLTEDAQAMMRKIEDCIHCGACSKRCPYGLAPEQLLQENYRDYQEILAGKEL